MEYIFDVSIILVNYNTKELTINCIGSIEKYVHGISYEIVVVDNASADGSKEYFEKDDRIQYIYNDLNIGFGKANNIGIEKCRGRNILFLNNDTLLLNDAITTLSYFLDKHPMVGAVGGNLWDKDMQHTHSYKMWLPSLLWEVDEIFGMPIEKFLFRKYWEFNETDKNIEVGYITGADLMLSRRCLDVVKGFNPAFFMYYEDTELCYRIKRAGFTVMNLPTAKIQHLVGSSSITLPSLKKIDMLFDSRMLYYKETCGSFYRMVVYFVILIKIVTRLIAFAFNKEHRYIWVETLRRFIKIIKTN